MMLNIFSRAYWSFIHLPRKNVYSGPCSFVCLFVYVCMYVCMYVFWLHPRHMEIPRPGTESEPQLWLTPQLQQCQILTRFATFLNQIICLLLLSCDSFYICCRSKTIIRDHDLQMFYPILWVVFFTFWMVFLKHKSFKIGRHQFVYFSFVAYASMVTSKIPLPNS